MFIDLTTGDSIATTSALRKDPSRHSGNSPKGTKSRRREAGPSAESLTITESAQPIASAARAYTTRRVPVEWLGCLRDDLNPTPGDLVLVRVEKLGQHRTIHLPDGRRRTLFEGDELLVAYANRYAPDQFEAVVPDSLECCHLVASGGVAARMVSWHHRMAQPTRIRPVGLVCREPGGLPVNVRDAALPSDVMPEHGRVPVLAVAGTSMNSGKTTTASHLCRGLKRAGFRPGYAKVTGTGAGGDPWLLTDAGACRVLDFTDAGHVSTYRIGLEEVERVFLRLLGHLQQSGVDVILLEVADGLYQRETAHLLSSDVARSWIDGILFAASDAMGAVAGATWLERESLRVIGVTGTLTNSPLQGTEVRNATGLRIIPTHQLAEPELAAQLRTQLSRS